jgi:hypothetical protein
MERCDIFLAQFMFLHPMHKIRVSGNRHPVFYLGKNLDKSEPQIKMYQAVLHK